VVALRAVVPDPPETVEIRGVQPENGIGWRHGRVRHRPADPDVNGAVDAVDDSGEVVGRPQGAKGRTVEVMTRSKAGIDAVYLAMFHGWSVPPLGTKRGLGPSVTTDSTLDNRYTLNVSGEILCTVAVAAKALNELRGRRRALLRRPDAPEEPSPSARGTAVVNGARTVRMAAASLGWGNGASTPARSTLCVVVRQAPANGGATDRDAGRGRRFPAEGVEFIDDHRRLDTPPRADQLRTPNPLVRDGHREPRQRRVPAQIRSPPPR
jgi:hypothetical protein